MFVENGHPFYHGCREGRCKSLSPQACNARRRNRRVRGERGLRGWLSTQRFIVGGPEVAMLRRRAVWSLLSIALTCTLAAAAGSLQPPAQFVGHRVGEDNKLIRWDKIVEYMKLAASSSDR